VICVIIISETCVWTGSRWSIVAAAFHSVFLFLGAICAIVYARTTLRDLLDSAKARGNSQQIVSVQRMLIAIGTLIIAACGGISMSILVSARSDVPLVGIVTSYYLPWMAIVVMVFILGRIPRERGVVVPAPLSPNPPSTLSNARAAAAAAAAPTANVNNNTNNTNNTKDIVSSSLPHQRGPIAPVVRVQILTSTSS
jgi:hypothetical protein